MKKILLVLFSCLLIYSSAQTVFAASATDYECYLGYTGQTPFSGFNPVPLSVSYSNHSFYLPVAWTSGRALYISTGYSVWYNSGLLYYNSSYIPANGLFFNLTPTSNNTFNYHFTFPVFNNIDDASAYSLSRPYNSSNIVGGTIPPSYVFSNNTDYQPVITSSDYAYLSKLSADNVVFNPIIGFLPLWADVNTRYTTQLNISFDSLPQVPTYQKSALTLYIQLPSVSDVQAFVSEYGFNIDSPLFVSNVNAFTQQHNSYRWINSMSYSSYKTSAEFIRDDLSYSSFFMKPDSTGFTYLVSEYGSETAAYIAFYLLGRIDSISLVDYGFDSSSNKFTAYPAAQWYYDKNFYDGSLYQKRQLPVSVPPDSGPTAPTYNNPGDPSGYSLTETVLDDEIQQHYTDLINDNNSTNEFNIYIQGVESKLDDWYNDGDLDIDEEISDVYSLLKSTSHIGTLFGVLLSGFLPSYVVVLMGFALALIPIVVIIRLFVR